MGPDKALDVGGSAGCSCLILTTKAQPQTVIIIQTVFCKVLCGHLTLDCMYEALVQVHHQGFAPLHARRLGWQQRLLIAALLQSCKKVACTEPARCMLGCCNEGKTGCVGPHLYAAVPYAGHYISGWVLDCSLYLLRDCQQCCKIMGTVMIWRTAAMSSEPPCWPQSAMAATRNGLHTSAAAVPASSSMNFLTECLACDWWGWSSQKHLATAQQLAFLHGAAFRTSMAP